MNPCAAASTTSAGHPGASNPGREAARRGAQARGGTQDARAPTARDAPGPVAGARHVACPRRGPLSAIDEGVPGVVEGPRGLAQGRLPGDPLLRPARTYPSRGRGRRCREPRSRSARVRGPLREGDQPRERPSWLGLEQPLSLARAPHAGRGAAWARLRPPQLPKAPAGEAGRRSAELRAMVRRVEGSGFRPRRRDGRRPRGRRGCPQRSCRLAEDVARRDRVATGGWPDRARGGTCGSATPELETAALTDEG
jgi:hypothetical protein